MDITLKLLLTELDAANKGIAKAADAAQSGTHADALRLQDAGGRKSSVVMALSDYAARLVGGEKDPRP